MYVPTRRLAGAVLVTAPAWWLAAIGSSFAIVVAPVVIAVLAIAALADALAIPGRRSVTVARSFPASVGVRDVATGMYQLSARWPFRVAGQLYDALPAALRRETPAPQPFGMQPGGDATVSVSVSGRDRGEWPLGPVALRLVGPLGLMARTLRYPQDDHTLVTPSIASVRHYRLLALQRRLRDAGVRVLRRRGEGTSFAGLREYVQGDDPRFIDWKASARRRALITREFSVEQGQTVLIVIDCGRLMTQLADDLPRFEYALSSALVLADVAAGSGDQVGMLAFDDEVRAWVAPSRGTEALRSIRAGLIPLRATMAEPDYATAFRTLDARQRKRALIVFYTDVIDPRASQSLIAHTARGARHHLPVVVALRNEALVAAAARGGGGRTTTAVYERAAAEELLSAREDALQRMRQAGVSVIDVRPQAMTAAVVNRYLELKGRGAV
jgi:uncharacterized protein (DUF58 family)